MHWPRLRFQALEFHSEARESLPMCRWSTTASTKHFLHRTDSHRKVLPRTLWPTLVRLRSPDDFFPQWIVSRRIFFHQRRYYSYDRQSTHRPTSNQSDRQHISVSVFIYFSSHTTHATVIQAKFFQSKTSGWREKSFETFDTDRSKSIVAEIDFHNMRTVGQ